MNETKCMCGRIIPVEQHTGLCQLEHFISYTGNGECGFDAAELRRIVEVVTSEAKETVSTSPNSSSCAIK